MPHPHYREFPIFEALSDMGSSVDHSPEGVGGEILDDIYFQNAVPASEAIFRPRAC